MAQKRRSAAEAASWHGPTTLRLSHAALAAKDIDWMGHVEKLTLWNVTAPPDLLASLKSLWWLDIRGGSAKNAPAIGEATGLRYLSVNQVRGLSDLSWLSALPNLELLRIYGLPQVAQLPGLRDHSRLERIELGSMKGLQSLAGLFEAPALHELLFVRSVAVTESDVTGLDANPALHAFAWFAEDVPDRISVPVVSLLTRDRQRARICHPEEWFASRQAELADAPASGRA